MPKLLYLFFGKQVRSYCHKLCIVFVTPGTPLTGSPGCRITVSQLYMLHSYTCDTTPVKSSVVQRGEQTDCVQSECKMGNVKNATAFNRQQSIARSAGNSVAKYSATEFRSRGRNGSL